MIPSVIPSLRYSAFASDVALANGSTAIESIAFDLRFFVIDDRRLLSLIDALLEIACSVSARSRDDWNRMAGFFSRQPSMMRCTSKGTASRRSSRGMSSLRIAAIVAAPDGRWNGRLVVTISKRMQPREKMSAVPSTASPRSCSGDM